MSKRTASGFLLALSVCAAPLALAADATRGKSSLPTASPGAKIRFNRDIRPILSDNCFKCHGPDPANRQAGLRLDRREGLFGKLPAGAAVVPGKPAASRLFIRMTAAQPAAVMPPPSSHKTLSPEQKALVRTWIEQGAPWEPHWSFVAPTRPAPPAVRDSKWVRNPIDRFVLARLEAEGLKPAPEADRRTLIRRLSLDLTGLPPEPADVEFFLKDRSPNAYEKLVDRLMAMPEWGEHRGRYWLDAARYGDTHGIHVDNYREIWPYREWVIQAFNRNLPFDQFTTKQIAGDLLPGSGFEDLLASGFHRCNITTSEGGSIPDEVAALYARDRVETTATVFLGLTANCASCHDHKFDPLAQKEFYQLAAFFRNTTQNPMDGNIQDTPPIILVPRMEDRARWNTLVDEARSLRQERDRRRAEAPTEALAWGADPARRSLEDPVAAEAREALAVPTAPGPAPELRFDATTRIDLGDHGNFSATEPFSLSLWVKVPDGDGGHTLLSRMDGAKGWTLELLSRAPVLRLAAGAQDAIQVRVAATARPAAGGWAHLTVNYDGSRRADGFTVYLNGKSAAVDAPGEAQLQGDPRAAARLLAGMAGARGFAGGALKDIRIYRRVLLPEEAAVLARWSELEPVLRAGGPMPESRKELLGQLFLAQNAEYRQTAVRLLKVEGEQSEIRRRSATTMVMQEKPDGQPMARVLFRGQYDKPGDEVKPGTPASLHPYPAGAPRNRLGLAQWLVDPKNPLTARVTVNRFWQELFGTGLVRTAEDFGIMGENPSHPELLDWLAVEFREKQWDVKAFFKLLVTSAAYRQSAAATPEKLERDPSNRLLSRGPRFRMDAEALRDFALASSGLLVKKIGGPSVKPYQPSGVWEAVAMHGSNTRFYKPDTGEALYRRSMYTFWKRSAPPASMDLFNAPSRENCTVRRERTNTPLQALVTLNDPQWVEAARHLAERTLKQGGAGFDARLDFITSRVLSRPMDAQERAICRTALERFSTAYRSRAEDAGKLIRTGESKPDASLPPAELAAWTMLCAQVMNLDEALCK